MTTRKPTSRTGSKAGAKPGAKPGTTAGAKAGAKTGSRTNQTGATRAKATRRPAKTIDLTAEDVTKREETGEEAAKAAPETTKPQPAETKTEPGAAQSKGASKPVEPPSAEKKPAEKTDAPAKSVPGPTKAAKDGEAEKNAAPDKGSKPPQHEKPTMAPSANPPSRKGGFGAGLLGGLLGGVAVVALGYAGLQQGYLPMPTPAQEEAQQAQADEVQRLAGDLSVVKNQLTELPKIDLAPVEARIAALEGEIAAAQEGLAKFEALAVEAVAPSEADAGQVSDPAAQDASAGTNAKVVAPEVGGRLEALAAQLALAREKIAQLEAQALAQTALIESKAAAQTARLEAEIKTAQEAILSSADRRINDVVTDLSNLGAALGEQASAITDRVSSLEDNNLSDMMQNSARTIALAGLENAVASGANYQLALSTFSDVVGPNEGVAILADHAETGAPTKAQLAADARAVYNGVLREAEDAGAASLLDKFLLSAQSLVEVRSLDGERKGESLSNRLGVIEYHVNEGDLEAALTEWQALPDAAREAQAGAAFLAGLKARVAVDTAMDQVRAEFGNGAQAKAAQ